MEKLFEVYDNRFLALLNPDSRLKQLCSGARWAEGPVYFAEGDYLIWSDIKNNRMLRWSDKDGMSVYRAPANYTNGNYRDLQGRMVTCSHGARAIQRTETDGSVVTLVERYNGARLNSPNDTGTITFALTM
jgi:gluconolactonase